MVRKIQSYLKWFDCPDPISYSSSAILPAAKQSQPNDSLDHVTSQRHKAVNR